MKVAAACLLLLAGCTAQSNASLNASLAKLASVTIADLNAAAADAGQHGDVLAAVCYPPLANWVMTMQAQAPITAPAGAFSAFQQTRDVYKGLTTGGFAAVPNSVKLGCSALYLDAMGDVTQFVGMLALIATGRFAPTPLVP